MNTHTTNDIASPGGGNHVSTPLDSKLVIAVLLSNVAKLFVIITVIYSYIFITWLLCRMANVYFPEFTAKYGDIASVEMWKAANDTILLLDPYMIGSELNYEDLNYGERIFVDFLLELLRPFGFILLGIISIFDTIVYNIFSLLYSVILSTLLINYSTS
jgi:hypothetical protein